ncbi:ASPIC/UnbV domain-containing protein [Flavitalea sp.]|nr:ASPIC/UnbV domain-containing protein [Flavitalea sp.]
MVWSKYCFYRNIRFRLIEDHNIIRVSTRHHPHHNVALLTFVDTFDNGEVSGQGGWLDSMTIAVNGNNYTDIHSILISKDGKLIYDKYFNGWTNDSIHDSRSAFKSITSILNITLKGVYSNTNAIGARVSIKSNGKWQYRWIESSSGYLGQNSFAAEFGLGSAIIIDSIIVRWPSGIEQSLSNLSKNQFLTITEISKPTGTNDLQYTKVKVYPKPASGKTYLMFPANRMIRSNLISVYDASGKMFRRTITSLGNGNYSIDLSGLSAGIYWIELKEKTINLRER